MGGVTARLASQNPNKARELAHALPGWCVELLGVDRMPPEEGGTYYENARAKALFGRARAAPGEWTLGEDSGVEVAGLGGAPGLHSARWADDGVARVLEELRGVEGEGRRARFVCELESGLRRDGLLGRNFRQMLLDCFQEQIGSEWFVENAQNIRGF